MDLKLSDRTQKKLKHLAPHEWKALEELVNRLYQQYGQDLLRVVLFGSKARGDFDEESDLDLLIVVRMRDGDYWKHWQEILDLTWDIELENGLVTSMIIKSEDDYKTMREHRLLLFRNIERDGVELWTTKPNVLIPYRTLPEGGRRDPITVQMHHKSPISNLYIGGHLENRSLCEASARLGGEGDGRERAGNLGRRTSGDQSLG